MKRILAISLTVFSLIFVLAACGEKSQEDVAAKLQENLEEMSGYKAQAVMEMNTGQESQQFNIDIWHKKEDFYRVALENSQDEKGSQVILKNEEGVFVLTPALNKSFKFQSEWPDNSSQPYLYQSLVQDVLNDEEAEFEITESHYVFRTKTNYQSNNNLPYQEIHFDKNTYTPLMVKVLDQDQNALVQVEFTEFNTSPEFAEDDFTMEKNMATSTAAATMSSQQQDGSLAVLMPTFTAGAELTEQKDVELEKGQRTILQYSGDKNFTLAQETVEVQPTFSAPQPVNGEIVNLGHTVGSMSENKVEWVANGVEYMLASEELTNEEMIEIAQSVQGIAVK